MNKWIIAGLIFCAILCSKVVYAESHLEHETTTEVESHAETAAHGDDDHSAAEPHTDAETHHEHEATTEVEPHAETAAHSDAESHPSETDHNTATPHAEAPVHADAEAHHEHETTTAADAHTDVAPHTSADNHQETETAAASETYEDNGLKASADKIVSIEYTLMLEDKSVQDTNVGKDPLNFVYGSNDIIPGLELALAGMKVGESKHVVVKSEDGYGPSDPEKFREIGKDKLPPDALVVGTPLQGQNASGKVVQAWVAEIKEDTVILNFNHRLAGQTLYFDVKVVDIKEMEETAQATNAH
ncbi:MAG: hypothetical protein GY941_13065 [Planctomycetes bacterium]|nr:hypothetical protein [Planctomycetota bacterium]